MLFTGSCTSRAEEQGMSHRNFSPESARTLKMHLTPRFAFESHSLHSPGPESARALHNTRNADSIFRVAYFAQGIKLLYL